jgi:5-formyltetrahydrofolate cyclo-ligase
MFKRLQLTTIMAMLSTNVIGNKVTIRNQMSEVLKNLSQNDICISSERIFECLKNMDQYQDCKTVCLYLSMPAGEVKTSTFLEDAFNSEKRVFIPKVTGKNSVDLKMLEIEGMEMISGFPVSKWGISEPSKEFTAKAEDGTYLGMIDCVLVPGVAFDSQCARLGHGKGYYGNYLNTIIIQIDIDVNLCT